MALRDIVDVRLREVQARLKDKHIKIDVEEHAKAWLAEKGYDPVYGMLLNWIWIKFQTNISHIYFFLL